MLVATGCGKDEGSPAAESSDGGAVTATTGSSQNGEGTGGVDNEVETSALTKKQFVKRANRICRRQNFQLLEDVTKAERQASAEAGQEAQVTSDALRTFLPANINGQIDEIRALGAPAGDEQIVEDFLGALGEAIVGLEEMERLTYDNLEPPFRESARIAREYGLTACAYA